MEYKKYETILKTLAEKLEEKESEILLLNYDKKELESKLKAAEAELATFKAGMIETAKIKPIAEKR